MEATPYSELSDIQLLALCCYREARGETLFAKRAVAHVVKNRASNPGWWGNSIASVILKPFQFSSFNENDVNNNVWPQDDNQVWLDCLSAAGAVLDDDPDSTDGATYYFDTSISFPKAWGDEKNFINTLNVGRLRFWKPV